MSRNVSLGPERWEEILREQHESGLSVDAYCRDQSLKVSTFHNWRRKIQGPRRSQRFTEVVLQGAVSTAQIEVARRMAMPCGSRQGPRPSS